MAKKDPLNPGLKINKGNRLKTTTMAVGRTFDSTEREAGVRRNARGDVVPFSEDLTFLNDDITGATSAYRVADGAAALYNKGFRLEITHVPSDRTLWFGAFIENFSDAYNSEWNAQQVYGRMDPISTYQQTRRAISVSWKIPAASVAEGVDNMNKVNEILSYLYPSYEGTSGGVATINMSPLWRIKFGNLISSANGNPQGLLGYVNGLTMDPIMEDGMFMYEPTKSRGPMRTQGVEYIPKTIRLNFEFTVLHEHPLGWTATSKGNQVFRGGGRRGFPYASRGLGVRMPPALTSIKFGQNPQRKNTQTPPEKRVKREAKAQATPANSKQGTVLVSTDDVEIVEDEKTDAQLVEEYNASGGLLNLKPGTKPGRGGVY